MPILNKPVFVKGQNNQITLNKSDLAQQVSDIYFQDSANWKQVVLFYETSEGKQRKVLVYDASQGTPAANFNISERARDEWQIKRVAFYDFDGGSLTINRGDLTVAEFDILLTPFFTRTFDSALNPWEESSNATFSVDHLLLVSTTGASTVYGLDDFGSEPKPITFGASLYRIEVDYYDMVSSESSVTFSAQGPVSSSVNVVINPSTNPSGTAVFNNATLNESGEDGFYFQHLTIGTSVKISEIRFYQL
jgi:hypothetical protein